MRAVSLFTGAGGMDLGFERAGFATVLQCDLFDASHLTDEEVGGEKPDEKRRELTRYGQDVLGVLERHWPATGRVNDVRQVSGGVCADQLHGPDVGRAGSGEAAGVGGGLPRHGGAGHDERHDRRRGSDTPGVGLREAQSRRGGVDVLHFGSPCQDLSVAGRRDGFVEGGRSHLFFEGVRVAREWRPGVVVWENVVGALNSNGGRDFAAVLAALADAGAVDIAWRVLDARWFGVPQRRRRVFVVADFGGERASKVLFEPEGGPGIAEASRPPWEGAAGDPAARAGAGGVQVAPTVRTNQRNNSHPLTETSMLVPIAVRTAQTGSNGWGIGTDEQAYTLDGAQGQAVAQSAGVRRLTPRECERLMGWPDDWTRWTADGREVSDSHRYRMCGNGVVAPVAEWIGRRIAAVLQESEAAG